MDSLGTWLGTEEENYTIAEPEHVSILYLSFTFCLVTRILLKLKYTVLKDDKIIGQRCSIRSVQNSLWNLRDMKSSGRF